VTRTFAFKPRSACCSPDYSRRPPQQQMNGVRVRGERHHDNRPPGASAMIASSKSSTSAGIQTTSVLVKQQLRPALRSTTYDSPALCRRARSIAVQATRYKRAQFVQANRGSLQHTACREVLCRAEVPAGPHTSSTRRQWRSRTPMGSVWSHINLGKIFDSRPAGAAINEYTWPSEPRTIPTGVRRSGEVPKTPYKSRGPTACPSRRRGRPQCTAHGRWHPAYGLGFAVDGLTKSGSM